MLASRMFLFSALLCGAAMLPGLAAAQGFNNFNGAPTGPVVGSANDKTTPRQSAPPALPGSRTSSPEAAPATPGASDLPPTEALFDAINRGDMTSARDAVNRGADVSGRNVLGLTPLDLSIDLGRNEITFLLLSLRPADSRGNAAATTASTSTRTDPRRGGKPAPPVARTAALPADPAAPPPVAPPTRAERAARAAQERADRKAAQAAAARPAQVAAQPPAAPTQPRQYAGQRDETGTPIPQMGFLGFGSVTR